MLLLLRIALASIYAFFWANPRCCHRKEHSTYVASAQAAQWTYTVQLSVISSNAEKTYVAVRSVHYQCISWEQPPTASPQQPSPSCDAAGLLALLLRYLRCCCVVDLNSASQENISSTEMTELKQVKWVVLGLLMFLSKQIQKLHKNITNLYANTR